MVVMVGVTLLLAGAIATPTAIRPALSRWVWSELSAHLERLFDATLSVESFDVKLFPSVRVEGRGLALRRNGDQTTAPLVTIATFSVSTTLTRLRNGNVKSVTIDGLTVTLPPDARSALKQAMAPGPGTPASSANSRRWRPLTIDTIEATHANLVISPNDPDGVPLMFDIEVARLNEFSTTEPARFEARVLNPKPRGMVAATGKLGPWMPDDPRKTHIEGDYTLKQADMSVFNGIGGALDSTGSFGGSLDQIAVQGKTEMVNFSVETGGHPMPLVTTFSARVDGTNGNTYLDRVSAKLGNSPVEASGEVAARRGAHGKTIRFDVRTDSAQLEDFITLVVSARPSPMRGRLRLAARMELPPGDEPVIDTLRLNGKFTITRGSFASDAVQDKVDELSRKGRGQPKDMTIDNVLSEFSGDFSLRDGVLQLPTFQFAVRGAEVHLAGSYGLRGELLGFTGELRLQARVSQTMTGFKSILLKVIDPFFSKHGAGAVLPIRVGGTVAAPEFGLNLFKGKKKAAPTALSAPPSRGTPSRPPES